MAKKSITQTPDEPEPQPDPGAQEAQAPDARGRQSAAPECPYHKGTRTVSRNSNSYFTRYYCPVEGCPFMIKQPRPQMRTRLSREDEDFSAR
ncbi:MAG TPA: hypothetical protein VMW52_00715 [Phycisphaerae bacterium]|nr:hypothetical protein [Phycisphaerae bacterium]